MTPYRIAIAALLSLLLALMSPASAQDTALAFDDPWVPEAPPGRMMAGFMVIENLSDEAVVLVDVRAEGFGHAEIHDMVIDDQGIMRMRRMEALTVPAGEAVTLASGGFHLMLMQPQASFSAGDHIDLVLIDANGVEHPVTASVRPR
jgi:copper(I)-binding protein